MTRLSRLFETAQNGTNRGDAVEEFFDLYFSNISDDERKDMQIVVDHSQDAYGVLFGDFLLAIPKVVLEFLCEDEVILLIIGKAIQIDFNDILSVLNTKYYPEIPNITTRNLLQMFNRIQEDSKLRYKIFQELLDRTITIEKISSGGKEFLKIREKLGLVAIIRLHYVQNNEVRKVLEKLAYHVEI